MEQWESDIHEHRRLVAYYMGDFISMTKPDNAYGWTSLENFRDADLTLYRLAQHCVARCGEPEMSEVIVRLGGFIGQIIRNTSQLDMKFMSERLNARAAVHDLSKFFSPEREVFEVFTPKLKTLEYGSDAYQQALVDMGAGLRHHYAVNSHHPEYHPNGVACMTLLDLIEMFCDWVAACDMKRVPLDVDQQARRFDLSLRLTGLLRQTRDQLRRWHVEHNIPSYF